MSFGEFSRLPSNESAIDGDRPVVLVTHDAAAGMLARELPPLMVERIAVAVARRLAKHRHAAIVFEPSQLPVVRYVAPHEIAPLAGPRGPLAPQPAGPQPLNRRVADAKRVERRVDRDDVGIRIRDRLSAWSEIPRRIRNHRGRAGPRRLGRCLRRLRRSLSADDPGNEGRHPRSRPEPVNRIAS